MTRFDRFAFAAALVQVLGSIAFAETPCRERIDACEDACPLNAGPDPNAPGETTLTSDPACVANCAALCSPGFDPDSTQACQRIEHCQDQCGVIIDPSTIGSNFVTVIKDPECMAACGTGC